MRVPDVVRISVSGLTASGGAMWISCEVRDLMLSYLVPCATYITLTYRASHEGCIASVRVHSKFRYADTGTPDACAFVNPAAKLMPTSLSPPSSELDR